MERLEDDAVRNRLHTVAGLNGWELHDNAIRRKFSFPAFMDGIAFVNRVAALAEAADHHPDVLIQFRDVTLTLSTHSEGGITDRDLQLAERVGRS